MEAYRRRQTGMDLQQLTASSDEIDGRTYVFVRQNGEAVAAYLIRTDGRLRRMSRLPDAIW